MTLFQRTTVSPFTAIAFIILSVTGALLFFHVKNGSVVTLHEGFGWAFILSGCLHLLLNLKPLLAYMTRRSAILSVLLALAFALALGLIGFHRKGGPGGMHNTRGLHGEGKQMGPAK